MTLFVGVFVCLGFYRCWDFKFVFLGGGSLGEFFLMEASSKSYAPPQSTSLLSLNKRKKEKEKKEKEKRPKKKEETPQALPSAPGPARKASLGVRWHTDLVAV